MRFRSQDEFSIYCKKLIENKGRSYYLEIPLDPVSIPYTLPNKMFPPPEKIYVITDSSTGEEYSWGTETKKIPNVASRRRWFFYKSREGPDEVMSGGPTYWCYRIHDAGEIRYDSVARGSIHWLKAYRLLGPGGYALYGEGPFDSFLNWRENPLEGK